MKTIMTIVLSLLLTGVARGDEKGAANGTKSIDLPHYQPYLPPGPGRELVASSCLSCHSTRYITMQPIVPAAKWEESVKKMIKTFGAPIRESDAPAIAQYLVAMQHAPPDPLIRAVSNPPRTIELTAAGNPADGLMVFARACASCHGIGGKGDGRAQQNLLPVATDLTAGRYSPTLIVKSVENGVPGTSMPAFPTLSSDDVQNVIAYVRQLEPPATPLAPPAEGKALFDQSCISCHGAEGRGDGYNAPTLPRAPTNFHLRQPSEQRAIQGIVDGVAGTSMPSWSAKLNEAQRKMLADYVRSLYDEQAR